MTNKIIVAYNSKEAKEYQNSKTFKCYDKNINLWFINKILENEVYYNQVLNVLKSENASLSFCTIDENNKIKCYCILHKNMIGYALKQAVERELLKLNDKTLSRYNNIIQNLSLSNFLENRKTLSLKYDKYSLTIQEIIDILLSPDYEIIYNKMFTENINEEIHGISIKSFIRLVDMLFNQIIGTSYMIPDLLYNRFKDIIFDYDSLKKYKTAIENDATKDIYKVQINEELKEKVLKNIPDKLNSLEKSIYIYIKLCQLLTYDSKFYITDGKINLNHNNLNDITSISPVNNEIVCFDFNMIYAKLLTYIGISPAIDGRYSEYSKNHETLIYTIQNTIIHADSSKTFIENDLYAAKVNSPLNGLTCFNRKKTIQKEFLESLTKVYDILKIKQLDDSSKQEKDIKDMPLSNRIKYFFEKIEKNSLVGLDAVSYILEWRKKLFNENEKKENVSITLCALNNDNNKSLCAIIVINESSIINNISDNTYYIFDGVDIKILTKDKIKEMLLSGMVKESSPDYQIPGINNTLESRKTI